MKKSGIIKRHVKRKIAALLLATMLLDQFPVTGYAEPLEWETQAEPAEQEQSAPEEAQPVTEEQTAAEEAQHVADEQAGAEEAKPVAEEQTGAEETQPAADEQAGSEETAPAEVYEAGGEDIIVEVMGTQENVSYIDENGDDQNCNNYTVLTGSENSLDPGWYAVNGDIVFQNSVILDGEGEYHIILADGGKMNIGTENNPIGGEGMLDGVGLGCSNDTNKNGINLTIYGQSQGTGQMNIYNQSGSNDERTEVGDAINVDELTINGGKLTLDVTGSRSCGMSSKNLTVNSGNINVKAAGSDGHAINSAGDITINGGTVTANATMDGNALYCGGNITISGNVTADSTSGYAIYSNDGEITINGGIIDAHTSDHNANAIVGKNDITINSGKVTAVTENYDASGIKSENGNITINDGEVYAEALRAINSSEDQNFGIFASKKLIINGGKVSAKGANKGIRSDGDGNGALSLSWKNLTDYISTNSLSIAGNVTIETGKTFTDGKGHYYIKANASEVKDLTDVKLSATTDAFYTVSFDCGGYIPVPPMQLLKEGSKVTEPTDPKAGTKYNTLDFAGWYQDTGYQISYDFNSKVTDDLYLHAKWASKSNNLKDASVKRIYRHTGSVIEPVVKDNVGNQLREGTDYQVSCTKEGSSTPVSMKDPGFYNLTLTGKNSYSGTTTVRVCVLTFEKYDTSDGILKTDTLPENTDAAVVTASTITMNTGWYVVTEDVKVNSRMRVKGNVHLVLCDGATLDATGNNGTMGISVTEGNSLTIYSQAGNTGKLKASSNEVNWYAGIGGDYPNDGKYPYLGKNKDAGNITIHGGEIIAKGSHASAAIGGAYGGNGGKITIYGGKITAERYAGTYGSGTDTGIGGNGAEIGAEIYLSWCRNDDFIKSDGYQGQVTLGKAFRIDGTSTPAKPDNIGGQKIVPTTATETYTVTFDSNGGTAVKPQEVLESTTATKPITPIKQGFRFEYWYKDNSDTSYNFSTPVNGDLTLHAKWTPVGNINFISANEQNISGFTAYSPMVADYDILPSGYYYVGENINLLNRVKVSGNVSLILGNGFTLTADKGISVMERENTLNIFGQSDGTGVLSAKAADNYAAIGGDGHDDSTFGGSVGNINIYGGKIWTRGADNAACIGGGRNNQYYGNICIYGGEISGAGGTDDPALGGSHGAAIGSGFGGDYASGKEVNGIVEIRGGKVTVKSNSNGTGIGGGHYAYGGSINILGGQVHVTVSSNDEPGIGDGYQYNGTQKARITLGCRDEQDFIYSANYNGNVKVAPNQTLIIIDDTSKKFRGDITNPDEITGKKLILGHSHFLTYVVNGGTVTATCTNESGECDLPGHKATFTLSAPNAEALVYDSTEKPPVITDEHNISGDEVVHYQKKNGNSWDDINAAPKAVGTYRASITLPDTGSGTATAKVEYTISKRPVTISGLAANDKIYDDTTTASVNITAMKLYNMIEGDAVSIVSGNADFDSAEVGKNKKVTFTGYTLTGAAAGNYNLVSQPEPMTANIAKRPVTIRANDQAVQYGEAIKEMAASFDLGTDNNDIGILVDRGHALTALTLTPDPDPRTYASPKDDGTITADGAVIKNKNTDSVVTDNYDINYVSGNLKITLLKAKITKLPTVNENLKYEGYLYDQSLVNPGEAETKMEYNVQQIVRGDSERVKNKDGFYVDELPAPTEGYSDNYRAWEAGTYRVWFRAASGDDLLAGEPDSVSVNIATVPLKVKVVDETIPFGERFPSMNAVEEGLVSEWDKGALGMRLYSYLVNGEWKAASEIKITQTYPDLGMYPARISYDMKGAVNYCYRYITSDGYLTVVPRTVSLNWGNVTSFTYDGKPHAPTVTLSNLSKNEVDGAVSAVVAGAQVNAGENYTATVVALSGDKASKYALPDDNTITFSIGKAEYSENIPDVKLDVPCSANFYTTSVAGKMPPDAGKLTYSKGTVSSVGFDITDGFDVKVDQNGLVTVTRKGQQTFPEEKKLDVCVNVDSTNYNRKSITTEATFVNKTDAGVRITSGNSLSVNYSENLPTLTLNAEASHSGTNGTWIWESSNPAAAEVTGSDATGNVTIKGVGTTGITVKYESDTTTGYATLILTVNPISVPVPKAKTGLSYNGTQQTGVMSSNIHYTLTGGTGTLPGDYIAIATLTDTKKYRWDDGTIEVKHISWSIEKQAGPSKPTGLEVVSPTTWANLDGQIKGVSTNMEYSKDPNFSNALPCTGTVIIGLTDGTYYVRVKETEYVKPGAAAEVVVPRVLPPIVRERSGLVYNGSPQVLVTADPISEGRIYYAVTGRNDPKPDKGQYSPEIPKKTNAGYYRVWYEIRGAGDPPEEGGVYVDIAQKDLRNVFYYISMSPNGLYGHEGMIDIRARVPEDNPRLRVISADTWGCIKDHPTIDNPKDGATTMRLHYFAARDEELPVTPPGVNRYVSFTVSVDEMVNYHAYNMTIKTTFFKECSTNHADTEALHDSFAPTCTKKGYTGGTWCHDCHGIIRGDDIPIDPDAHDFDMENGEVTKKPTSITLGEHTYHCRHNRAHTLVIPDIPILPPDDGVDYSDFADDVKDLSGDVALKQTESTDKETGEVTKTVFVGGDEISKITKDPASGKETVESKIWVAGIAPSYTYTGSRIDPDIHVYDGTRKLEPKTDYTVTYKNDKEPGTAKLLLKFKGNYKGTKEQTINYSIVPAVLGRDILAYDVAVAVKSKAQKPLPSLIWASTGKAVSSKFFKVTYDGAESVKKEGTYTAVITSNNKKFEGTMTAKVIVVGKKGYLLSKAKVKFSPKSYVYTGSEIIPAKGSYTLKLGGRQLVEGTDYKSAYVLNNTYPGTATVVFEGMGTGENSPAGTKTATFRITGNRKLEEAGNGSAFTYTYPESIPYAKGGAKPAITIKDNGVTLKEGKDYTLSYSKNKAVTNGEKTALIKVTGKGTYKGSVTLKFKITKQSLNAEGITVEARDQFTTLKKLKKPSVTVIDTNGKKLKAGTDYTIGEMDTSIPGNTDESGQVFIILTGKGNYSSEAPAKTSFRYMAPSANMSRTKTMRSISAQVYTGSAVYLGSKDLSEILYTGSKSAPEYLVYGKDFAVSGYKNNKKKGTAKVILKGLGSFAGTKTLTFRIAETKGDYKGALIGDKWQ